MTLDSHDPQSLILITTTLPNLAIAQELAHDLVKAHLVACGQILPAITSIYIWQGQICQESEHLLLLKTRATNYPLVEAYIKQNHPYTVPQITAIPISYASNSYQDWLCQNTTPLAEFFAE